MKENQEEIIVPDLSQTTSDQPQQNNISKSQRKQGLMIATIILFVVASLFAGVTLLYLFSTFSNDSEAGMAISFVFFITIGWVTFLPALGCAIAGIVTGAKGCSSKSKGIKITCILFLILCIILTIAIVLLGMSIMFFPAFLSKN